MLTILIGKEKNSFGLKISSIHSRILLCKNTGNFTKRGTRKKIFFFKKSVGIANKAIYICIALGITDVT